MNVADNLNPTGQRFYLYSQTIIIGGQNVSDKNRIYMNHTPAIEKGQLVGLTIAADTLYPLQGPPRNIGPQFYNNDSNLIFGSLDVFLTIVNKKGEVLFQNIPWTSLFPFNGKIHKYNAVNIDTRKSYFSLATSPLLPGNLNINVIFIMNYQ